MEALDVLTIDCRFCNVNTPVDVETATMVLAVLRLAPLTLILAADDDDAGGVGVAPREIVMGDAPLLNVNAGVAD